TVNGGIGIAQTWYRTCGIPARRPRFRPRGYFGLKASIEHSAECELRHDLWGSTRCGSLQYSLQESRMRIIYRAANIIDANLVKNALEQEGILAFVNGEYLPGGVGQLPASDFLSVMVADDDVERAQAIAEA